MTEETLMSLVIIAGLISTLTITGLIIYTYTERGKDFGRKQ